MENILKYSILTADLSCWTADEPYDSIWYSADTLSRNDFRSDRDIDILRSIDIRKIGM